MFTGYIKGVSIDSTLQLGIVAAVSFAVYVTLCECSTYYVQCRSICFKLIIVHQFGSESTLRL